MRYSILIYIPNFTSSPLKHSPLSSLSADLFLTFLSWKMKSEGFHNSGFTSLCPHFLLPFFGLWYPVHDVLPYMECYGLNNAPSPTKKLHVEVLAPNTSECDLVWGKGHCRWN